MKIIFLRVLLPVWVLFVTISGCGSKSSGTRLEAESEQDGQFRAFQDNLVLKFWRLHPEWATSQGYHRYDSALVVPDDRYRERLVQSYQRFLEDLEKFNPEELSGNNRIDYQMIRNFLLKGIWQVQYFKEHEWNPALYNLGPGVAQILQSRQVPLEERLRALSEKLSRSVLYYEAAIDNLRQPTLPHTRLAIEQNQGALEVLGPALLDSVNRSQLDTFEKDMLRQRIETTRLEMQNYVHHLQERVVPAIRAGQTRSFRIGENAYEQKFQYDLSSGYSADEIYEKAMLRKRELHAAMGKLTDQLWTKYFPGQPRPAGLAGVRKLLSRLSQSHVPRDSFLFAIQEQIPVLENFVQKKNLLTLDPAKPLVVRPTPAYMRGIAGASVSAPGPYEKNAPTYYNVAPLDHLSPAEAQSFLREYNRYLLQILNIHEAVPGHYTQLVYSNRSPSLIKAILGNGAMVEGWAVYAEQMMLEQGYGNNQPEMWLMWYKWHLRVVLNAILDYSVHVLNMTEAEALQLLKEEGFQEEAEARGKWRRATLSQVQLASYFTGYTEIRELRREMEAEQGKDFNLKAFHEQFLSYGSAPVRYIRQLMLSD